MASTPSIKAILICDQIIHELGTNKKSLIGIFEDIHMLKFPSTHPRIGVYVNLTDAHGEYAIEVRMLGTDRKEIARVPPQTVRIDNPLKTCELALQMQNTPFKEPGKYEFQIFANGELLATKGFNVRQAKLQQKPPPGA
jgi:hypothetical protein